MDQLMKYPKILMDNKNLLSLTQKPSLTSLFLSGPFCSYYFAWRWKPCQFPKHCVSYKIMPQIM